MLDHDPNKGRIINTIFQLKNVEKTENKTETKLHGIHIRRLIEVHC